MFGKREENYMNSGLHKFIRSAAQLLFAVIIIFGLFSVTSTQNTAQEDNSDFMAEYAGMLRMIYLDAANSISEFFPKIDVPTLSFNELFVPYVFPDENSKIMVKEEDLARRFGTPVEMTYGKAINGANPKYKTEKDINGLYSENCQRAIIAYELRRRGYDVEAKPSRADGEVHYESVEYVFKNLEKYFVPDLPKSGKTEAENLLREWGNGARARIRVEWQNGGSHVFIGENSDGKVIFLDPQTREMNVEGYFNYVVPDKTIIMRIDNAQLTKAVYHAVRYAPRVSAANSKWAVNYSESEIIPLNGETYTSIIVNRN